MTSGKKMKLKRRVERAEREAALQRMHMHAQQAVALDQAEMEQVVVEVIPCSRCGAKLRVEQAQAILDISLVGPEGPYTIAPVPACGECTRKFNSALPQLKQVLDEAFEGPYKPALWVPGRPS